MSNTSAFLAMIAACEGADYNVLYGGGTFAPGPDHPRRSVTAGGYTSTAAGRYQILSSTWDAFVRAQGPHAFDEAGQDACALWLIADRHALEDVQNGLLASAIDKTCRIWASLPGAPYGQPTRSYAYCEQHYLAAGGVLHAQGDVITVYTTTNMNGPGSGSGGGGAVPETSTTVPKIGTPMPLLVALLPSILQLFAPRAQAQLQKITGSGPDVVEPFLAQLFGKIQAVTGQADPVQAVAALKNTPALVATVQESALDYLDKLAPILDRIDKYDQSAWTAEDAGRNAAATRALAQQDAGPLYGNPTFLLAVFVMALVGFVVGVVLLKGGFSTDMQAFVIGAVVGSALTAVLGFYFGSSRNSSAKDATIAQLANK